MRALITGHAGFLGRNFKRELERRGWTVMGIDPEAVFTWGTPNDALRAFVSYGVREQFDLVIHAAARSPHRKAIDENPATAAYNQLLDAAMFDWAIRTKQKHVLYISSSAVYSDEVYSLDDPGSFMEEQGYLYEPFDDYGQTKRAGERLARIANNCGVPTTVIRPFSGYGPDQSADFPFGAFIRRAVKMEEPFTIWGDANQQRDFVHVNDIVNGALALVENNVTMPVNICTGRATSMLTLAKIIIDEMSHLSYRPEIKVDVAAPMGVKYRIGDPSLFHQFYRPQWSIRDGVVQALKEALSGRTK